MPYIDPEVILEAKQMDLLTYLQTYEPQEPVRFSFWYNKNQAERKIKNRAKNGKTIASTRNLIPIPLR